MKIKVDINKETRIKINEKENENEKSYLIYRFLSSNRNMVATSRKERG